MNKIALSLPGSSGNIDNPPGLIFSGDQANLASVISGLLSIAFYVAGFLAFYYLVWGALQYIVASGNKEQLQKARQRIIWALVGLLVVVFAYLIATYASEIFPPRKGGVPF